MAASPEQRLLDAVYRQFGKPATYTVEGQDPIQCTVQVFRPGNPQRQNPMEPMRFTGTALEIPTVDLALLVRSSEIAVPVEGAIVQTFVDAGRSIPGAVFVIGDAPIPYDADGEEWRCAVSSNDAP